MTGARRVTAVAYGLLSWFLLVELIGVSGKVGRFLLDTSLFHQMAAVPASPANWTAGAGMGAVGVVAAAGGSDLQPPGSSGPARDPAAGTPPGMVRMGQAKTPHLHYVLRDASGRL